MFFKNKAEPKDDINEFIHQWQAQFEANQLILSDLFSKAPDGTIIDVEFSVISQEPAPNTPQTALQLRNGN